MLAPPLRVVFSTPEITPASPSSSDGYERRIPTIAKAAPAVAASPSLPFTAAAPLDSDSDVDDDPFVGYVLPRTWSTDSAGELKDEEDAEDAIYGLSHAYDIDAGVTDSYEIKQVSWLLDKEFAALAAGRYCDARPVHRAAPPTDKSPRSGSGSTSDDDDDDPFAHANRFNARDAPTFMAEESPTATPSRRLHPAAARAQQRVRADGAAILGNDVDATRHPRRPPPLAVHGTLAGPFGDSLDAAERSRRESTSTVNSDPFARYMPGQRPAYYYTDDDDDVLAKAAEQRPSGAQVRLKEVEAAAAEAAAGEAAQAQLQTGTEEAELAASDVAISELAEAGIAPSPGPSSVDGAGSRSWDDTGSSGADVASSPQTEHTSGMGADAAQTQRNPDASAAEGLQLDNSGDGGYGTATEEVDGSHEGPASAQAAEDGAEGTAEVTGEAVERDIAADEGVPAAAFYKKATVQEAVEQEAAEHGPAEREAAEQEAAEQQAAWSETKVMEAAVIAAMAVFGAVAGAAAAEEALPAGDGEAAVADGAMMPVAAAGAEGRKAQPASGDAQTAARDAVADEGVVVLRAESSGGDTRVTAGSQDGACKALPCGGDGELGSESPGGVPAADGSVDSGGADRQLVPDVAYVQQLVRLEPLVGSACTVVKALRRSHPGGSRAATGSGTATPLGSVAAGSVGRPAATAGGARASSSGGSGGSKGVLSSLADPHSLLPADEPEAAAPRGGTLGGQSRRVSRSSGSQSTGRLLSATPCRTSSSGSTSPAMPAVGRAVPAGPLVEAAREGRSRFGRAGGLNGGSSAIAGFAPTSSRQTGADPSRLGGPGAPGSTPPHGNEEQKATKQETVAAPVSASIRAGASVARPPQPAGRANGDIDDSRHGAWLARPADWLQHLKPQEPAPVDMAPRSGGAGLGSAATLLDRPAPPASEASISIASEARPRLHSAGSKTNRRHSNGLPLRQPTGPLPGIPLLSELAHRYPVRQAPAGSPQIALVSGQLHVGGRLLATMSNGEARVGQTLLPGSVSARPLAGQQTPGPNACGGQVFQSGYYLQQRRAEKAQRALLASQQQRRTGHGAMATTDGRLTQTVHAWGSRPCSDKFTATRLETGAGTVVQHMGGQGVPVAAGNGLAAAQLPCGSGRERERRESVERWVTAHGGIPAGMSSHGGTANDVNDGYSKMAYGKHASELWPRQGLLGVSRGVQPRTALRGPVGTGGAVPAVPPLPLPPSAKRQAAQLAGQVWSDA